MAIEDQVKALEDEFKLLKSEMRQTLVNVRDFLMDLKLPQIQEEAETQPVQPPAPATNEPQQAPRQNASESGHREMQEPQQMPIRQPTNPPSYNAEPSGSRPSYFPPRAEMTYALPDSAVEDQTPLAEDDLATSGDFAMDDITSEESTAGDIPMENEQSMPRHDAVGERTKSKTDPGEAGATPSQINLLANLIRWVASAKREIGIEQLPVFLDVYAISGNLPQTMKAVILHLAAVATDPVNDSTPLDRIGLIKEQMALFMRLNALSGQNPPEIEETIARLAELMVQQSNYANRANVWSQLLLELNGILGDGTVSLHMLTETVLKDEGSPKAVSDTEESAHEQVENKEEEQEIPTKSKSARLRLVLPNDSGAEQELDLGELLIAKEMPKHNGNGHKKVSISER